MKKVILALAIVSVSFAACNGGEETAPAVDTTVVAPVDVDTTTPVAVDTTAAPAAPAAEATK